MPCKSNRKMRVTPSPCLAVDLFHLTVLIETMRREGFELEIGPRGDHQRSMGKNRNRATRWKSKVPDEYAPNVVDLLNRRKGEMQDMGKTDVGDYRHIYYLRVAPLV